MNLNFFDDMSGAVFRERENSLADMDVRRPNHGGNAPGSNMMTAFPSQTPLAMAYVPFQQWGETLSYEESLKEGTVFSELVFPFEGGGK